MRYCGGTPLCDPNKVQLPDRDGPGPGRCRHIGQPRFSLKIRLRAIEIK
jgi:hypothetical protein